MNRARRRALRASLYSAHARYAFAIPLALSLVFYAAEALARPGGGHTFSTGSSHSGGSSYSGGGGSSRGSSGGGGSSSSGDGGGLAGAIVSFLLDLLIRALIELLIYLFTRYPQVMIPLLAGLGVIVLIYGARESWMGSLGWASNGGRGFMDRLSAWRWIRTWDRDGELALTVPTERVVEPGTRNVRRDLRVAVGPDEHFSVAGFEDFAQGLYAAVHQARGRGELANFGPYLAGAARDTLRGLSLNVADVSAVVVGSMSIARVARLGDPESRHVRVEVDFVANYTERDKDQDARTYFVHERWTLRRDGAAQTRKVEGARTFGCPNCGAPLDRAYGVECAYCKKAVHGGAFDWNVISVVELERSGRNPVLETTVEEQGTGAFTVLDPGAEVAWMALQKHDPALTEGALAARVKLVFDALQIAWGTRKWSQARAFLTDPAYDSMRYWIELYEKARMRNVTEDAALRRLELARVERDGPFDVVTLRVFASSLDYTVYDADPNTVVSGSKTERRAYTEYWTLLRSHAKRGAPKAEPTCPACGAELKVSMAGECEYCKARVVSGEFDWVLSRIEQDDVYAG